MVEKLYSDFDVDISIVPADRKTFFTYELDSARLMDVSGVAQVLPAVEEIVVLKHEQKWGNAQVLGIDSAFLSIAKMNEHMVDGYGVLHEGDRNLIVVGATLLDKLDGFVPTFGYESLVCYAPKRGIRMKLGSTPFKTKNLLVSGRMNYNREVNADRFIMDLEQCRELLGYHNECTAYFIDLEPEVEPEDLSEKIQELVGENFQVKTRYQKNELIYKTSKSEKMIVVIILLFVFIIAAFTLVAALTMLYIEKKANLKTLNAIGADQSTLFKIMMIEGLLIARKGVVIGLILGYGICFAQLWGDLLVMPNSAGEPFPIALRWMDFGMILVMVSTISFLASYLPAKFLIRSKS